MKMEKPVLEVVRFNTGDVIATSGGIFANLNQSKCYSALRTEAAEAGMNYDYSGGASLNFVDFYWNNPYPGFVAVAKDEMNINHYYAWFNNGQWQTDDKEVTDYAVDGLDNKSTAGWRTS